jgi:hypothetical protein
MLKQSFSKGNEQTALRSHLYASYGRFADKRVKNVKKARRFFVDNRENGGLSSDGSYYGWFCGVTVDVMSDDAVLVNLYGSLPDSPQVRTSFTMLASVRGPKSVSFTIDRERLPLLRTLASQILEIVAPGNRYPVAGYKHMCPWVADSLEELAGHLDDFWNNHE